MDLESRFREIHSGLKPGFPAVSSAHVENLVDDRYPWVISLARSMPAATDGGSVGIIQVDLNYEIIADLCRNIQLGTSGYVFILDGKGDLVYHPRQQLIYGNLKSERFSDVLALNGGYLRAVVDGREVLYTAASSSQTGWTVVAVSYPDELFSSRRHAEYYFLMLALLSFVTAIGAAHLISTTISKPIGELRRSMQAVESGNFDIDITVQTSNEIYQLARDCDIAIKKVRDLIEQNRKEQELKRALELRALQAQINPHLLYNTLDSIIWMIELGENQNAIDMTSSLAKLFRLAISKESEMISIRNEIEYVEAYLAIQKQRYKEKLSYEIAFSPELYGFKIMKLLIQPLVENAIYHGIKGMDGPGHIKIIGEREDSAVVIRVGDNGVGMSAEILSALNEGNVEPSTSGGVGVKNVQERIRLSFGTEYGVRLESVPGAGTTAVVRIPVDPGRRRVKNRTTLFFLLGALAAAVVLTFLYRGSRLFGPAPAAPKKVVVIFKTIDYGTTPFWGNVRDGVESAGKDFNVSVSVRGARNEKDVQGQIAIVRACYGREARCHRAGRRGFQSPCPPGEGDQSASHPSGVRGLLHQLG